MNVPSTPNLMSVYQIKGHSLTILKAIELLKKDGYKQAATFAEVHLLPLLLGVIWADAWGDSEFDGSQILHYFIPDNREEGYGFGSSMASLALFKNSSQDYKSHRFYGYGNSVEYAEDRYSAALRACKGLWGLDAKDHMAGWVVDKVIGQSDPLDSDKKCWAEGVTEIDNPPQTRFGSGQTPASVLDDLFTNYSDRIIIFPSIGDPNLSTIVLPNAKVLDEKGEWFDSLYRDACDVETYCGWDGHNYAYYSIWADDADNKWFLFRAEPNSFNHAYFLLGWSLHLLHDSCQTVHTINSSSWTWSHHNNIEDLFDKYIVDYQNFFPANTLNDFRNAVSWSYIENFIPKDKWPKAPQLFFKKRWYCNKLNQGIPTIGEYAFETAILLWEHYKEYIQFCSSAGPYAPIAPQYSIIPQLLFCVQALEFDLAIKATAGTLLKFFNEIEGGPKPSCDP